MKHRVGNSKEISSSRARREQLPLPRSREIERIGRRYFRRERQRERASSLRATAYRRPGNPSTSLKINRAHVSSGWLFPSATKCNIHWLRETVRRRRRTKKESLRKTEKELLSGNWRARRMAVLICTRSLELKVPSGVLINLGVREERRFLDRDSRGDEGEKERPLLPANAFSAGCNRRTN